MPTTDRRRSPRRTPASSAAAPVSASNGAVPDAPDIENVGAGSSPNGSGSGSGNGSPAPHGGGRQRAGDDPAPIIPILARRVREVEAKSMEGKVGPAKRTKFQVIALLVREERARIRSDASNAKILAFDSSAADPFAMSSG